MPPALCQKLHTRTQLKSGMARTRPFVAGRSSCPGHILCRILATYPAHREGRAHNRSPGPFLHRALRRCRWHFKTLLSIAMESQVLTPLKSDPQLHEAGASRTLPGTDRGDPGWLNRLRPPIHPPPLHSASQPARQLPGDPPIHLLTHPHTHSSIIHPSIISMYLPICPSIHSFIYPTTHPHPSVHHPPIQLSIHLPVTHPPACPSTRPSPIHPSSHSAT